MPQPTLEDLLEKNTQVVEVLHKDLDRVEKEVHDRVDKVETFLKRSPRGADDPDAGRVHKTEREEAEDKALRSGDVSDLKGLSVGIESDGGYFVSAELEQSVYRRTTESTPLRSVCSVRSITSDSWEQQTGPDLVTVEWVGEKQGRSETGQPSFGGVRIPVHEIHAQSKATSRLLDDSRIDIASYLSEVIGEAFGLEENAQFTTGDGISKPRGFLDYSTDATTEDDADRTWGVVQYVPSGDASSFDSTDPGDALIDLQSRLKPQFRPNAVWMMSRATARQVRQFKDGQGNYLWQPSFMAGQPDRLLGHRVILNEDMPAVGANTFPIAFADFRRAYYIIDRIGLRVLRDPYTDKPHVLFDMTKRVGGDLFDSDAIKLFKIATS